MPYKPNPFRITDGPGEWMDYYAGVGATGETYTLSNVTTDRTLDANDTSMDELADILGTLIADLQTAGIID